jgi:hypothetical protein
MSPVAILMTWTAFEITSAGRLWPLGIRGMLSGKDSTMKRASLLAAAIGVVGISLVADKSALFVGLDFRPDRPAVFTGTITEWRPGESIVVAGNQNPRGFELRLRHNTVYEGTIKPGAPAMVWYRTVGERRLVVERVRVLSASRR